MAEHADKQACMTSSGDGHFVHHPHFFSDFSPACFDPDYWQRRNAITGTALGRGTTWFVKDGSHQMVLRHNRRGGLFAELLGESYLRRRPSNTRAMREFRLLDHMCRQGLPVPRPCAAAMFHDGLFSYRAALIIELIPGARDLVDLLQQAPLPASQWEEIGRTIARLHQKQIWHSDLNAHNIMIDAQNKVWLIDFDKCRQRSAGRWQQANLDRLLRSLHKEAGKQPVWHWQEAEFAALRAGYAGEGA